MELALAGMCILASAVVAIKCVTTMARTLERTTDAMTALADKDAAAQVSEMRLAPHQPQRVEVPPDMAAAAGGWDPRFATDLHDVAEQPINGVPR